MSTTSWRYEEKEYDLQELCHKHPPPVVVQCQEVEFPLETVPFDLSEPILLYRQRKINKVIARSLHCETYCEIGPTLYIPEDYRGWFAVLQKRQIKPGTFRSDVLEFKLVADLSNSDTQTFLIGGTEQVEALQVTTADDGKYQHRQRSLFPGEVLRRGKIYIGESRRKSGIFRRSKVKQDYYLLCTDECEREILLPFTQKGVFYALTTDSGRMPCPVLQMKDILDKKYIPATVKLLYGRMPTVSCLFTGVLRLEHFHFERSVVACTVQRSNFIELPITCALKFRIFEMDETIISSALYKRAYSICNEKAHLYTRSIKVCNELGPVKTISVEERLEDEFPHVLRRRNQSDARDDDNRESGYIEMRDSLEIAEDPPYIEMGNSIDVVMKEDDDYVLPNSDSKHHYFGRTRTENVCKPLYISRHQSFHSPPPTSPPPPLPTACGGTLPRGCRPYLELDSGISDGNQSANSQTCFSSRSEKAQKDTIYDIPRIPRRSSAPDAFDMYAIRVPKQISLDTLLETSQGGAIEYENFSILREVIPKPCGKVINPQRKPMELTHYDYPQNIDVTNSKSCLDTENVDSQCCNFPTSLEDDINSESELNIHSRKDQLVINNKNLSDYSKKEQENDEFLLSGNIEDVAVDEYDEFLDTGNDDLKNALLFANGGECMPPQACQNLGEKVNVMYVNYDSQRKRGDTRSMNDVNVCNENTDITDSITRSASSPVINDVNDSMNHDITVRQRSQSGDNGMTGKEHNMPSNDNVDINKKSGNITQCCSNSISHLELEDKCLLTYTEVESSDTEANSIPIAAHCQNNQLVAKDEQSVEFNDKQVKDGSVEQKDDTLLESQKLNSLEQIENIFTTDKIKSTRETEKQCDVLFQHTITAGIDGHINSFEGRNDQSSMIAESCIEFNPSMADKMTEDNFKLVTDGSKGILTETTTTEMYNEAPKGATEIKTPTDKNIPNGTTMLPIFENNLPNVTVDNDKAFPTLELNTQFTSKNLYANIRETFDTASDVLYNNSDSRRGQFEKHDNAPITNLLCFVNETSDNVNSHDNINIKNSKKIQCKPLEEKTNAEFEIEFSNPEEPFKFVDAMPNITLDVSNSVTCDENKTKYVNRNNIYGDEKTNDETSTPETINEIQDGDDILSNISTDEILIGFRKLGIRKNVTDIVEKNSFNGTSLKNVQKLNDIFPGITCVDKRKISMFLQGMMQTTDARIRRKHDSLEPIWV